MMDDTGIPVIDGMFIRDGWGSTSVRVRGRSEDVFISPDGVRYVRAGDNERADLVYHRITKRYAQALHVRLRLEKGSSVSKRQRREEREVVEREIARSAKQEQPTKRRKAVRRKR